MTGYTVRRCEQLETFPETIEQELRPAVCERRLTDRLKENYSIDIVVDNVVTQIMCMLDIKKLMVGTHSGIRTKPL